MNVLEIINSTGTVGPRLFRVHPHAVGALTPRSMYKHASSFVTNVVDNCGSTILQMGKMSGLKKIILSHTLAV